MKKTVQYPQGHVLLRNLSRLYPVISHGKGPYLFDTAGKKYFDASGGTLVSSLGHGNTFISKAVAKQLSRVAYVNGHHFTSEAAEELARRLAAKAKKVNSEVDRSFFLSSGSEANEAAFKFVRQVHVDRGQPQRFKIIARTPGYHGNTLFALSASGRPHYRKMFGPLLSNVPLIAAPYEYRSQVPDYAKNGAAHYSNLLEEAILKEGPETVAAFVVEPIIGSSAGASVPPPGYFERVRQICDRHGILIIADEVMCGAGRTGSFFASEQVGLKPDVILMGKGISAGYVPLSAVLVRSQDVEVIRKASGNFMHAQTYLQAPSICAAGCAALREMDRLGAVSNARRVGKFLERELRKHVLPHPAVGFISGRGMMWGVEFVKNKSTRQPFDRAEKIAERFVETAFSEGLIVWPNVGQADGHHGDLIMLGPPLTLTEKQAIELVRILVRSLDAMKW